MPARGRIRALAAVLVLVLACAGLAVAVGRRYSGRIGPSLRITGNGRHLTPPGRLVKLGTFPTGGALTPDGRFYWTVSTGRALNDIRIVSVRRARVIQTLPLPGASGGLVIDGARSLAYVSGVADSTDTDEMRPGLPGRSGDVIHVFHFNKRTGRAAELGTIRAAAGVCAIPQDFPPKASAMSWPERLAVSANGRTLLVPLGLAAAAAVVDARSHRVRYVATGAYPYGAAILPGGRRGLVSNEAPGTVSVIALKSATKLKDIQVGAILRTPRPRSPRPSRAYVAVTIATRWQ